MTNKEALNYFKRRKEMWLDDKIQEYENKAIEALEKQIPKQPIYQWNDDELETLCPRCKHYPFDMNEYEWSRKFCGECGQAIDWE